MIKATMASAIGAAEQSNVRDTRHEDERSTEKFASVMAGAMHAQHAHKHAHVKPKTGTSELDAPKESANDSDGSGTSESSAAEHRAKADTSSSSNDVVRSVGALDPALQAKLARVTARMREETGKDVKVSETYRSQSRQDTLFAQGRETAGPVVTWTQNSKHTQGRAVDVLLAGDSTPDAYSILQRIANEEGLRTLGAIDPGHLELPGTGATSAANGETPTIPVAPADASGPGMVSVAGLAQVAKVASVAHVATVAQVARVGAGPNVGGALKGIAANQATVVTQATTAAANQADVDAADDETLNGAQPITLAPSAQGAKAPVANVQGTHAQNADSQSGSQKFGTDSGSAGSDNSSSDKHGYGALDAAFAMREQPSAHSSSHNVAAVTGTSAAERVARIIALDDAPARPLSQITMNVDAGNGTSDRIQVGLRGSSLNATIDTVDIGGARAMTARSDELVRALSRDGVQVESLRVRATATATATPVLAPQNSRSSSDSSSNARSDRGNPWKQQDKQQSDNDRRQQQRDKRGGFTQ